MGLRTVVLLTLEDESEIGLEGLATRELLNVVCVWNVLLRSSAVESVVTGGADADAEPVVATLLLADGGRILVEDSGF